MGIETAGVTVTAQGFPSVRPMLHVHAHHLCIVRPLSVERDRNSAETALVKYRVYWLM